MIILLKIIYKNFFLSKIKSILIKESSYFYLKIKQIKFIINRALKNFGIISF